MDTYQQLAAAVLVAHQRRDIGSCLCGWSELGHSHAEHVASVLAAAGALQVVPAYRDVHAQVDAVMARELTEARDERDRYREALERIAWTGERTAGGERVSLLSLIRELGEVARSALDDA